MEFSLPFKLFRLFLGEVFFLVCDMLCEFWLYQESRDLSGAVGE